MAGESGASITSSNGGNARSTPRKERPRNSVSSTKASDVAAAAAVAVKTSKRQLATLPEQMTPAQVKRIDQNYEKFSRFAQMAICRFAKLFFKDVQLKGNDEVIMVSAPAKQLQIVSKDPQVMNATLLEPEIAQTNEDANQSDSNQSCSTANFSGSPRSLAIDIVRTNDKLSVLKKENIALKIQLNDYQVTLDLVMSKYRAQMARLLDQTAVCNSVILSEYESPERLQKQAECIALSNRLEGMKTFYEQTVAPTNEAILLGQREQLAELLLQHETLVELYQISAKYGSLPTVQDLAKECLRPSDG